MFLQTVTPSTSGASIPLIVIFLVAGHSDSGVLIVTEYVPKLFTVIFSSEEPLDHKTVAFSGAFIDKLISSPSHTTPPAEEIIPGTLGASVCIVRVIGNHV